jgi:hypothetical protein
MPRFFFNTVCPDRCVNDIVGEQCTDAAQAKKFALDTASQVVTSQLKSGTPPSGWIEVEDEEHRPVFMLPFRAVAS